MGGSESISLVLSLAIWSVAFAGTLFLTPAVLNRLKRTGFVVSDMYKPGQPAIVTHAGLLVLAVSVVGLIVTFFLRPPPILFLPWNRGEIDSVIAMQLALFTICGYGVVGAIDDRHSLSHFVKAAIPLALGIPAILLALSRPWALYPVARLLPGESFQLFSVIVIVPVYVLVVANLINMHSGFNGLQSGLSLILLGTLLARLTLEGRMSDNIALLIVAGSLAAFYPFNRFPARAFEGNVGSFLIGATVGVGIASNGLLLAGVVMLAPHILDFMLFSAAKSTGRRFIKYGAVREDGTIAAPYPFKLKFLIPFYFRLTERQTVRLLYLITGLACLASFSVHG